MTGASWEGESACSSIEARGKHPGMPNSGPEAEQRGREGGAGAVKDRGKGEREIRGVPGGQEHGANGAALAPAEAVLEGMEPAMQQPANGAAPAAAPDGEVEGSKKTAKILGCRKLEGVLEELDRSKGKGRSYKKEAKHICRKGDNRAKFFDIFSQGEEKYKVRIEDRGHGLPVNGYEQESLWVVELDKPWGSGNNGAWGLLTPEGWYEGKTGSQKAEEHNGGTYYHKLIFKVVPKGESTAPRRTCYAKMGCSFVVVHCFIGAAAGTGERWEKNNSKDAAAIAQRAAKKTSAYANSAIAGEEVEAIREGAFRGAVEANRFTLHLCEANWDFKVGGKRVTLTASGPQSGVDWRYLLASFGGAFVKLLWANHGVCGKVKLLVCDVPPLPLGFEKGKVALRLWDTTYQYSNPVEFEYRDSGLLWGAQPGNQPPGSGGEGSGTEGRDDGEAHLPAEQANQPPPPPQQGQPGQQQQAQAQQVQGDVQAGSTAPLEQEHIPQRDGAGDEADEEQGMCFEGAAPQQLQELLVRASLPFDQAGWRAARSLAKLGLLLPNPPSNQEGGGGGARTQRPWPQLTAPHAAPGEGQAASSSRGDEVMAPPCSFRLVQLACVHFVCSLILPWWEEEGTAMYLAYNAVLPFMGRVLRGAKARLPWGIPSDILPPKGDLGLREEGGRKGTKRKASEGLSTSASPLSVASDYPDHVNAAITDAGSSWLTNAQIMAVLEHFRNAPGAAVNCVAPRLPEGGTLYLVDSRLCKAFRSDGHVWKWRKSDGQILDEYHMKLYVSKKGMLHCYYSRVHNEADEETPLNRRIYRFAHSYYLVLIHYLHAPRRTHGRALGPAAMRALEKKRNRQTLEAAAGAAHPTVLAFPQAAELRVDAAMPSSIRGVDLAAGSKPVEDASLQKRPKCKHLEPEAPYPREQLRELLIEASMPFDRALWRAVWNLAKLGLLLPNPPPNQEGGGGGVRTQRPWPQLTAPHAALGEGHAASSSSGDEAMGPCSFRLVQLACVHFVCSLILPWWEEEGTAMYLAYNAVLPFMGRVLRGAKAPLPSKVEQAPLEALADPNQEDEEGATPLYRAALEGNEQVVRALLDAGADPNKAASNGCTPLWAATSENHMLVVGALLEAKADPNTPNSKGCSPLFNMALKGREEMVRALLKARADPNQSNGEGTTPLYIAAQENHEQVVRALLDAGPQQADPNKANEAGCTPLWTAAFRGHILVVKTLLKYKADPNIANNKGRSPLFFAAFKGWEEVVRALLEENAEVNQEDEDGSTPLYEAAQEGHEQVVRALLGAGANPNMALNKKRRTPLWTAASRGRLLVVQALLEYKANPNQSDEEGISPLYIAAREGHEQVVQALLEYKANPNQSDGEGISQLYIAAREGDEQVVRALLGAGAYPNKATNDGLTPLWAAAFRGHLLVVWALLEAQADPNFVNSRGRFLNQEEEEGSTPLCIAAEMGHEQVVRALLGAGADPNKATNDGLTPLWIAAFHGRTLVVQALLEFKADPNIVNSKDRIPISNRAARRRKERMLELLEARQHDSNKDKEGTAPLYVAAQEGYEQVVRALLGAGADPNKATKAGRTPLWAAASRGHILVVRALLEAQADSNQSDWEGQAPLFTAAQKGHDQVVRALLGAGADPNKATNDGRTPLSAARSGGHTLVVQALEEAK